jgi:hypothetical protein
MSRPFNERTNYDEEVVLIQRMIRLFRADTILPEENRDKVVSHLREALKSLATEAKQAINIEDRLLRSVRKAAK